MDVVEEFDGQVVGKKYCVWPPCSLSTSLSLSVFGVLKELITIVLANQARGDPITPTNISGFMLCSAGILVYQMARAALRQKEADAAQQARRGGGGDAPRASSSWPSSLICLRRRSSSSPRDCATWSSPPLKPAGTPEGNTADNGPRQFISAKTWDTLWSTCALTIMTNR